jgi:hypothetical protein
MTRRALVPASFSFAILGVIALGCAAGDPVVAAPDAAAPDQPITGDGTATIAPAGGTVGLAGVGAVSFPAGAFAASQPVRMETTAEARAAEIFELSAAIFRAGARAPREVRINTGALPPADDAEVTLAVPGELSVPPGYGLEAFAQVFEGNADDLHDEFDLVPSRSEARGLTFSLSAGAFSKDRRTDGTYEAVVLVATVPGGDTVHLQQTICTKFPSPLERPLKVTSGFNPNRDNGMVGIKTKGHPGTDFRADNGDPVVSVGEGKVVDARESNGATDRARGWGTTAVSAGP